MSVVVEQDPSVADGPDRLGGRVGDESADDPAAAASLGGVSVHPSVAERGARAAQDDGVAGAVGQGIPDGAGAPVVEVPTRRPAPYAAAVTGLHRDARAVGNGCRSGHVPSLAYTFTRRRGGPTRCGVGASRHPRSSSAVTISCAWS